MKKFLIALALGIVLVLALATVASADNGPHGGFNGSTDACASCHRAHSAVSADGMLLVASDIYTLCTNCHDGTGAYTNVVDGYYDNQVGDPGKAAFVGTQGDAGVGLFGGGFVNARMLTDYGNASNEGGLAAATNNVAADQNTSLTSWARLNAYDTVAAAPVARATTSNHGVSAAGRTGTVWGSGNYNTVNGTFTGTTELECTSCHNPHGNAGRNVAGQPVPSYRLLDYTPVGSNGFEVGTQVSATGYWDTDLVWGSGAGAPLTGTTMVPSAAGVLVPDRTTKWYSVNNNITVDPSLGAYRGRVTGGEIYVANFAGQGDYMGRYYGYRRPSATSTVGVTTGTLVDCNNPPAVPPVASAANTACAAATGTAFNNTAPHDALGFWCSTCHDRYLAPGGASRTTDSGDASYHYRHRSQAISTNGGGMGSGQYTCVDCHNAHGTVATASSSLASDASYAKGSVLLKGDNRAVCTRCHAAAVNFFNVTTSPLAPMILVP